MAKYSFCRRKRTANRGFTLLEILITLLLLVVGVVAVSRAFSRGMLVSAGSRNMELALNIARAQMEEIENMDYDNISSVGSTPAGAQHPLDNFDVTVTVTQKAPSIKQVDVNVSWLVKGGIMNVPLTTVVADNIGSGSGGMPGESGFGDGGVPDGKGGQPPKDEKPPIGGGCGGKKLLSLC